MLLGSLGGPGSSTGLSSPAFAKLQRPPPRGSAEAPGQVETRQLEAPAGENAADATSGTSRQKGVFVGIENGSLVKNNNTSQRVKDWPLLFLYMCSFKNTVLLVTD